MLCLCACLLALVASLSSARGGAQSGRKSTQPAPASKGKNADRPRAVNSTPTPTPVFVQRPIGPIAGPEPAPPIPTLETKEEASTQASAPATVPGNPTPTPTPTHAAGAPKTAAGAARADEEEVDEDEVVRISSNLVPVPASVVDAQGRAVTDLQLKDFELLVDGELRPIGDVSRAETPVSIALLYDNSSSLRAGREFEKQAAIRFLKSVVRPIDRAAIYSISTEPELAHPLTNNVRALVRTIERFVKPEGATALFDTIAAAADYLKPQTGRKVIVIVSDGTDTLSYLDFDTTMARVLADDCQVYAVQTGHSDNSNLRDLAGERRLLEFAGQTGGAVYMPRTNTDLNQAFTQIAADLAQQYVLGYYPTGERRDGRFRTFSLRVTTRPNLRVRTRKGYYSPKG